MKRLKQKEIADFRLGQLLTQGGICPLCDKKITPDDAVLDHCHTEGHVRRVLHRACNSSEGRVMKWAYSSKHHDPIEFLKNLIKYHEGDYTNMPLHHTYLTKDEKELKKLRKHQKTLKTQRGRDKVQVKIDALIAMVDRDER